MLNHFEVSSWKVLQKDKSFEACRQKCWCDRSEVLSAKLKTIAVVEVELLPDLSLFNTDTYANESSFALRTPPTPCKAALS